MTAGNDKTHTPDASSADQATARFTSFGLIGDEERKALMALAGPFRQLARGEHLVRQGEPTGSLHLLLGGWTASTVLFRDGTRTIPKVHMPGDLLGGPSMALTHSADSIVALTPITVTPLLLSGIGRLFETNPRLAAILFLIAQEERVFLMDRLASVTRSGALEKVAFLLVQLHARASRNKHEAIETFDLPLAQSDLADLVGLTTVHTNRMLQRLRNERVVSWSRGRVTMLDLDRLKDIAGMPTRTLAHDLGWLPAPTSLSAPTA